jgi:hypothetical protein
VPLIGIHGDPQPEPDFNILWLVMFKTGDPEVNFNDKCDKTQVSYSIVLRRFFKLRE